MCFLLLWIRAVSAHTEIRPSAPNLLDCHPPGANTLFLVAQRGMLPEKMLVSFPRALFSPG